MQDVFGFVESVEKGLLVAIFHAYCDESGKSGDHPVITFSSVCLPHSKLQAFDTDWRQLLRQIEKPSLHMARASRLREGYGPTMPRGQSFRERSDALRPFAECINKHFEFGMAIALEVEGFAKWSERARRAVGRPDDPFYVSFMRGLLFLTGKLLDDDRLSLICDDDLETAWDCYRFYCSVRRTDEIARTKIVALSFANDIYFPGLQAADMLAFLFRLHARHEIDPMEQNQWGHLFDDLATTRGPDSTQWYISVSDMNRLQELDEALSQLRVSGKNRK